MWNKIFDGALALVINIIPPPDAEHDAQYRWRQGVAVFLLILGISSVGNLVHIAWACGFLPGFSGFAAASELPILDARRQSKLDDSTTRLNASISDIQGSLSVLLQRSLEDRIWNLRTRQCHAIREKNTAAVNDVARQLQDALDEYQRMNQGRDYRVPDCGEI